MKKYNKPEIETLALETVDVIAVSAVAVDTGNAVAQAIGQNSGTVKNTGATLSEFTTTWDW